MQKPVPQGSAIGQRRKTELPCRLDVMSFTVVPLYNVNLTAGTRIPFGDGPVFQDNPEWVKTDTAFLNILSEHDKRSVLSANHAFVIEYEASSIGETDPEHQPAPGEPPRTIQDAKTRLAMLANLAIWLRQPSPLCFTVSLHANMWQSFDQVEKKPVLQQSDHLQPLYCHPKDVDNIVTSQHIVKAAQFYPALNSIRQGSPMWVPLRAVWAGLTSYASDIRYLWFWIALEALFGPEDSAELSHKLAERIAFFLTEKPEDARNLFQKSKKCYGLRSKIVHGRWKHSPDIDQMMEDTEAIVRTALRRVIERPDIFAIFATKKREEYLAGLIFNKPSVIEAGTT
jgi:hypothetical protein